VVEELLKAGREVRVLDVLLHGQEAVAQALEGAGAEVLRFDIRDGEARRRALQGVDAVVHLAAIVGDPACAGQPELSREVNLDGARAVVADALAAGVRRLVFASTCSNYGRMADPTVPVDEGTELRPVSLYAAQKVEIEEMLLGAAPDGLEPVCLRFATVYGVAPRMRFDLTVNEFTLHLWSGRELEVFGEQFWRPYIHVRDAARAVRCVLASSSEQVAGEVFNTGSSKENYRKLDLVEKIREQVEGGEVTFVKRDEDPRDYKVSFEKIRSRLGFEPASAVRDGVNEVVSALEALAFPEPFSSHYRNVP